MLLNIRFIAISASVVSFFAVGLIGWCNGISQFTCCKRAIVGAVAAYIVMTLAAKAVNAVLISAMIQSQLNQTGENADDNRD